MRLLAFMRGLVTLLPVYYCSYARLPASEINQFQSLRDSSDQKKTLSQKSRMVEVSAHGMFSKKKAISEASKSNRSSKKYFFKVHPHSEDTVLAEKSGRPADSTITEVEDWKRTDLGGDVISAGWEELEAAPCKKYPELPPDLDTPAQLKFLDDKMLPVRALADLEKFTVSCEEKFPDIHGWMTGFHFTSRGYYNKLLESFDCCQLAGETKPTGPEFVVTGATPSSSTGELEYFDNKNGDLLNIACEPGNTRCRVGNEDSALTAFRFEPGTLEQLRIVWTSEKPQKGQKFAGDIKRFPLADAANNWEDYRGIVRMSMLRKFQLTCPWGHALVYWEVVRRPEQTASDGKQGTWRIEHGCRAVGEVVEMGTTFKTCSWRGDPHYTTFNNVKHDPMYSVAADNADGNYAYRWVVKSNLLLIQSFYQGLGSKNDPMRTRGIAVGGKAMLGTRLSWGRDIPGMWKGGKDALQWSPMNVNSIVKFDDGTGSGYRERRCENDPIVETMGCSSAWGSDSEGKHTFQLSTGDPDLGAVSDFTAKVWRTNGNGGQVHVSLPYEVTIVITERSGGWMDASPGLTMKKFPGWEEAQCGEFNNDDDQTSDHAGLADLHQVPSAENLFTSDSFTGGAPGSAAFKSCQNDKPEKYAKAKAKCDVRFGDLKTDPIVAMAYMDCLIDLCSTEDKDDALLEGDQQAGLQSLLAEAIDTPRGYALSQNTDPVNVHKGTCTSDDDCSSDIGACKGAPDTFWENKCTVTNFDAPANSKLEGICVQVRQPPYAKCDQGTPLADATPNADSMEWCHFMRYYERCTPGAASNVECPAGHVPSFARSKGEMFSIDIALGELATTPPVVALGAYSVSTNAGVVWQWMDGSPVDNLYGAQTFKQDETPSEAGLTLCMITEKAQLPHGQPGQFKACTKGHPVPVVCAEPKLFAIMRKTTATQARASCSDAKQLAQPRSVKEMDLLSTIMGQARTEFGAQEAWMWIGGHCDANREWLWDDNTKMYQWLQAEYWKDGDTSCDTSGGGYLCLMVGSATSTPKFSGRCGAASLMQSGTGSLELDVLCETTGPSRQCKLSSQEMSFTMMQMAPTPYYQASVDGHCYYVSYSDEFPLGMTCNSFCRNYLSGTCDDVGLQTAAQSVHTCEAIIAKLGIAVNQQAVYDASKAMNGYGCGVTVNQDNNVRETVLWRPYLNDPSDDVCGQPAYDANNHRICSCRAEIDENPTHSLMTPGFQTSVVASNQPTGGTGASLVQGQQDPTNMEIKIYAVGGGRSENKLAYKLLINWQASEVTRSCVKDGQIMNELTTGNFPFNIKTQGHNFFIDFEVEQSDPDVDAKWLVFANGMKQDSLTMTASCNYGQEIEVSNQAAQVFAHRTIPAHAYTNMFYYPPQCVPRQFPVQEEGTVTVEWLIKYNEALPADLDGDKCIFCENKDLAMGTNIMTKNGQVSVSIEGNAPRVVTFNLQIHHSETTKVAISYVQDDQVLELYINNRREEVKYYVRAMPWTSGSGHLGCAQFEEKKFPMEITNFRVTLLKHPQRPTRATCDTALNAPRPCKAPEMKMIDAESAIKTECAGPVCTDADASECCDVLPTCKNDACDGQDADNCHINGNKVYQFLCLGASRWRHDANTTYCEDKECQETEKELCCVDDQSCLHQKCPDDTRIVTAEGVLCDGVCNIANNPTDMELCCQNVSTCAAWGCDPNNTHRHNFRDILCGDLQCSADDEDRCCVSRGNCLAYTCPDDYIHKGNAARIQCYDESCNTTNWATCCVEKGKCSSLPCDDNSTHIASANFTWCTGLECSREADHARCCVEKAKCSTFVCNAKHEQVWNAAEILCAGRICYPDEHDKCCGKLGMCSTYDEANCGSDKILSPKADEIMCDHLNCNTGSSNTCCVQKDSCASYDCLPTYSHLVPPQVCSGRSANSSKSSGTCNSACWWKPDHNGLIYDKRWCYTSADRAVGTSEWCWCSQGNHSIDGVEYEELEDIPCGLGDPNRTTCADADLTVCCQRNEECSLHQCPTGTTKKANAGLLYCNTPKCKTPDDDEQCCVAKGRCSAYNCSKTEGMTWLHNAHFLTCNTEDCDDDDTHRCCGPKGNCTVFPCEGAFTHKPNATEQLCESSVCAPTDRNICCRQAEQCSKYTCPHRYFHKHNAGFLYCEEAKCSHADLHTCCQMEGLCINFTCTGHNVHVAGAEDTLCVDRACSPDKTPEDTCCAEANRCNAYDCPTGYVHKPNASEEFCKGVICNDYDLPTCCDQVAMCTDLRNEDGTVNCPEGKTLNANHVGIMCKNKTCSEEDWPHCCVPRGSCFSYPCGVQLHRQLPGLLCDDENCSRTEDTTCCAPKNRCDTFKCPEHHIHVDNAHEINCGGFICGPDDKATCCHLVKTCANYQCPPNAILVHDAVHVLCKGGHCVAEDRVQCCTELNKCNAFHCGPGTTHRHNADEIYCSKQQCDESTWSECCVEDGRCDTYKCPEKYVHIDNPWTQHCANWQCSDDDLETCCLLRENCSTMICNDHEILNWQALAGELMCANRTCSKRAAPDNETCCTPATMCDSIDPDDVCGTGMIPRHDADTIECSDKTCDSDDVDNCCAREDVCITFNCPDTHVHRWDAETRECQGFVCDDHDTDHCCAHRAFCNEYDCDEGSTLRNASHLIMCINSTCHEADDQDTCCDREGYCSDKVCPEGEVHKANASQILCNDKPPCLRTNDEKCCMPAPSCLANVVCDHGFPKPALPGGIRSCSDHNCTHGQFECCDPPATCDEFDLAWAPNFTKRHRANEIHCAGITCSHLDLHRCAAEFGFCSSYACMEGMILKHNAHEIRCEDMDCNATAEIHCCVNEGNCTSHHCSPGETLREDAYRFDCVGEKCVAPLDDTRCCAPVGTCQPFCCNSAHGNGTVNADQTCPDGQANQIFEKRAAANEIMCEGLHCNAADQHECCKKEGHCTSINCSTFGGYFLRHNASSLTCVDNCAANEENRAVCCDEDDECPTYTCPEHMVHKNNSENTKCSSAPCTDADQYICCDMRRHCGEYPCEASGKGPSKGPAHFCLGIACSDAGDIDRCCHPLQPGATGNASNQTNEVATSPASAEPAAAPAASSESPAPAPAPAPATPATNADVNPTKNASNTSAFGGSVEGFAFRIRRSSLLLMLPFASSLSFFQGTSCG